MNDSKAGLTPRMDSKKNIGVNTRKRVAYSHIKFKPLKPTVLFPKRNDNFMYFWMLFFNNQVIKGN